MRDKIRLQLITSDTLKEPDVSNLPVYEHWGIHVSDSDVARGMDICWPESVGGRGAPIRLL